MNCRSLGEISFGGELDSRLAESETNPMEGDGCRFYYTDFLLSVQTQTHMTFSNDISWIELAVVLIFVVFGLIFIVSMINRGGRPRSG